MDPNVTVGGDVRTVFEQHMLDTIAEGRNALTAGRQLDMRSLEVSLTQQNHPLMALFIMFFLENRFAQGAEDAARQLNNLNWLEGALLRAGVPQ